MGSEDALKTTASNTDSVSSTTAEPETTHDEPTAVKTKNTLNENEGSEEGERPPLPPRPSAGTVSLLGSNPSSPAGTLKIPKKASRPQLQSHATTALSRTDIHTQSYRDGSRATYAQSNVSSQSRKSSRFPSPSGFPRKGNNGSDADDSASLKSFAPTIALNNDLEGLLGEAFASPQAGSSWNKSREASGEINFDMVPFDTEEPKADFSREFDEVEDLHEDADNQGQLLEQWRSKRKHFHILSAAGKPIYNRHGSDNLISGEVGVIQTIISFYEGADDGLKSFSAGRTLFVVITRGPLYLVAISKLGESEIQLQAQLEALYMQILSTLTLPTIESLFSKRPSTDLRRPLQGTEGLLSSLCDSFTRGSPSTLLSSLECLRIKHRQRQAINNAMLKTKCKDLLYGLIVAGGRLVSVVRPRSHSLHPGDLQLIFNMLFEAGGVKANGGESWIPMCLPGFNHNGYLYMFVSFIEMDGADGVLDPEDGIAIILLSANKETSIVELRTMRDHLVDELEKNGHMDTIKEAVRAGRPPVTEIVPGSVLKHFLYKSRGNLQFVMPSYEPHFTTVLERRRLLSQYHRLHAAVHSKESRLKVYHCISRDSTSLAWITNLFELYCVASPTATRNAVVQSANKVVQWIRREEERIFIIGGAVF